MFSLSDRFVEMGGIPVNDDGSEEVEPSHAVVLALDGALAQFAVASGPQRVLERVVCLALVQAGVASALHIGVEQPKLSDRQQRELCRMQAAVGYTINDFAKLF